MLSLSFSIPRVSITLTVITLMAIAANTVAVGQRPVMMWTGVWEVPADAPLGTASYTVTAKDKFGRTATFTPFPNRLSQLTIVE